LKAKAKAKPPVGLIIAGIAGGVVVLLAILFGLLALLDSAGKKNIRFGLTEGQRASIFFRLVEAIDNFGMGDSAKKAWRDIQAEYKIDRNITREILKEGFASPNWRQPDSPTAKAKAQRKAWVAARTPDGSRDPMLID
jgi:hypothetical protein